MKSWKKKTAIKKDKEEYWSNKEVKECAVNRCEMERNLREER